jgi:hypothetical protein
MTRVGEGQVTASGTSSKAWIFEFEEGHVHPTNPVTGEPDWIREHLSLTGLKVAIVPDPAFNGDYMPLPRFGNGKLAVIGSGATDEQKAALSRIFKLPIAGETFTETEPPGTLWRARADFCNIPDDNLDPDYVMLDGANKRKAGWRFVIAVRTSSQPMGQPEIQTPVVVAIVTEDRHGGLCSFYSKLYFECDVDSNLKNMIRSLLGFDIDNGEANVHLTVSIDPTWSGGHKKGIKVTPLGT